MVHLGVMDVGELFSFYLVITLMMITNSTFDYLFDKILSGFWIRILNPDLESESKFRILNMDSEFGFRNPQSEFRIQIENQNPNPEYWCQKNRIHKKSNSN
uniref:Uncharacterized protein n=1 Tax=Acrobeloides nanus TaxID=290746 RepID=A0A914CKZ3_9BILA